MGELPADLERLFRELGEQEGGVRPEALSEAYLRALEEIEHDPRNRPGQDKSWVVRSQRRWHETINAFRRKT